MPLTINGKTVEQDLLDAEFGQIKAHFEQQANISCCERNDEFMGYAKENIIARTLLAQDAEEAIPPADAAQIDAHIEQLAEQHGSEETLYFNLGIPPGGEAELRREVDRSIRVERLVEQIGGDPPPPTGAELAAYYDTHRSEFANAEQVRSMHIFKSLQSATDRETLFAELREVRAQAMAGTDFMELVRAHSDKPEDEADLGWYRRGELMDEFELVTFSMEVGEISPVFATQWGMHLAKLCERKPPQPIPPEEVATEISQRIAAEHRDAKLKTHIDSLRERAEIVDTES